MAFKMSQEFLTVSLDVMLTSVTLLTLIIFTNIHVQTMCVHLPACHCLLSVVVSGGGGGGCPVAPL